MLYNHCADVIMASRDLKKLEESKQRILAQKTKNCGNLYLEELDLASLQSVDQSAKRINEKYDKLNVLINNAGLMIPPYHLTKDGFESQIGTNHMGHFAFTLKLLDLMKRTAEKDKTEGRIINVSSSAHKFGTLDLNDLNYKTRSYGYWESYGQSKTANILFTKELNRRLKESGVNITSNTLHPGGIKTGLQRHPGPWYFSPLMFVLSPILFKSIPQGAATQLLLATHDSVTGKGGMYYDDCQEATTSAQASDMSLASKLFDLSEQLTDTKYPF